MSDSATIKRIVKECRELAIELDIKIVMLRAPRLNRQLTNDYISDIIYIDHISFIR